MEDYTIDDLIIEIRNFRDEGFKFWLKILLHRNLDMLDKNHVIYGEINAIKEKDELNLTNEIKTYYPYYLQFISRLIDTSELIKFLSICHYYRQVQIMKQKEKKDEETILEIFSKYEEKEVLKILYNSDLASSRIAHYDILLNNLNCFTKLKPSYTSPIDYSKEQDSTTMYYLIDFSASKISLDGLIELENITENYYYTIYDLVFDKFKKNLHGNGSILKNKLLFTFPKSHRGKVKIDIFDNKLQTKIVKIKSEKLLLQLQAKRLDPLEITHYNIEFNKNELEKDIELEFIPDEIRGWLYDTDSEEENKIQKIVEYYKNLEPLLNNPENLRKRILDGEDLTTEFKQFYPAKENDIESLKDLKIIQEVCGLANAVGGLIIFGVRDEDLEIIGYNPIPQFNSPGDFDAHIQNLCSDKLEPPVICQMKSTTIDKKQLFIVNINENKEFWVRIKSSKLIYIRKGSSTRKSTPFDLIKCPKKSILEY